MTDHILSLVSLLKYSENWRQRRKGPETSDRTEDHRNIENYI